MAPLHFLEALFARHEVAENYQQMFNYVFDIWVPTKIGSANMDRTKATVLVKGGLEQPEFLTVVIQKEILYFSSSHNPKIESCNLDGTNR